MTQDRCPTIESASAQLLALPIILIKRERRETAAAKVYHLHSFFCNFLCIGISGVGGGRQGIRLAYHLGMANKLRWGVLSTANIGIKKVLPGMQKGQLTSVDAIASRDLEKARSAAITLGIPKAYGSYEELLADPEIDAIYNPLPNQLHVPWTIKSAEAGKHVLCEKPLAMTAAEAETLLAVRARTGVKIGEAFMIRSYPQWLRVRELLDEQRIGELRSIAGVFSYYNNDPANIRNQVESGGGALMDIGCYLIHA
jgi:predicted dehydrogenase